DRYVHLSAEQRCQCGAVTAKRHVDQVDASHHLKQFSGEMTYGPRSRRRHVDFALIGLRVIDELGNRLGGERWICQHGLGLLRDARDRSDIAGEIEIKILVERGVDCVRRAYEEERIAVWRRSHDGFGGDIGGSTRSIFDDEWLAKTFRQPLSYQPRDDVVAATGCKTHDQAHRPHRIRLRLSEPRCDRQRGSARGQMQKNFGGERSFLNLLLASYHSITSSARATYRTMCLAPQGSFRRLLEEMRAA